MPTAAGDGPAARAVGEHRARSRGSGTAQEEVTQPVDVPRSFDDHPLGELHCRGPGQV